ncbi:probable serine/threonine-protein kinase PBL9 [Euphorbia lathyris]|uniref:probable serine/threonine-protein kinase PBL9 n=1 Tax=Euphorbia lathyris TaxID=212925 RepID=UPI003313AC87
MATKRHMSAAAEPPVLVAHSPQGGSNLPPSNHSYILGALIIFSVTFSVLVSLCILFRRRIFPYFSRFSQPRIKPQGTLEGEGLLSLRRFSLEELERATERFSEEFLLGSGAFGNVYKANFGEQGCLAIKRAHADSFQSVEEFRNETGGKRAKVLIYEYVPNGSLLEYIIRKRGRSLTWRQRVNIAIGAAKGIAHLHDGVKPSIIHRDIKPSNILIGEGFEAKVSDFGLVKLGPSDDKSHVSSQIKGTPGYLDPAYCSSFHLSPFSDVYSFGVILLQLISARPAVDCTRNPSNYHIIEWARRSLESGNVAEILDANLLTEPCNMEMMLKMGQLGLRCVVQNPKKRPTMNQVRQELEDALYSLDTSIHKDPSRGSRPSSATSHHGPRRSVDCSDSSQSFVSIDGVRYEGFGIEMDSISFQSESLRCLEANSFSSIDVDKNILRVTN